MYLRGETVGNRKLGERNEEQESVVVEHGINRKLWLEEGSYKTLEEELSSLGQIPPLLGQKMWLIISDIFCGVL